MVKRIGDFVDDGLNGSPESIDGGWVQAPLNQDVPKVSEAGKLSSLT
jgi:amidophosphoribosyltransferase